LNYPKIILKKGKERSLQNYHPWIFSGAIQKQDEACTEGGIVEVYSDDNRYLCTGHFHHGSITVRAICFEQREINRDFWNEKLAKAFSLRNVLGFTANPDTNVYRLCHGEGDGLPGLIIDIYNHAAVIQAHTLGMYQARQQISDAIVHVMGSSIKAVYDKSSESLSKSGEAGTVNGYLYGGKTENVVMENGFRFLIDWEEGQKTGFFIDQRDNRDLLRKYTAGKKVLNTFSYTGGFSVYAMQNAAMVDSVDSSQRAMDASVKNMELNGFAENHRCFTSDVLDFVRQSNESYDVIILDPPAFAKHLSNVDRATVGYRNLNYEVIRRIKPGGILFTFSCSQAIDKTLFGKIIFMAASQAKRNVRILHRLSQPADHPVSIYHPEGEYLKGLVLYIE
jgi:23S rRNA (cytosine1962-C5)-methyltransferase